MFQRSPPYQVPVKNQGVVATLISRGLREEAIEIWGDGSVVRDFLYIDDVVDALLAAAADASDTRMFNIGSGRGRSLRDVIADVERLMNKKLNIKWNAGRSVDVPVSVVAIERARDKLHWVPNTPFETGLETTIDWWRKVAPITNQVGDNRQ